MENIFFSGSDTKLNQRLYLGKKGLDGHHADHHTRLAEIITGPFWQVGVPIFIELISDGNKSDFLMFLNSVTEKQSQNYLHLQAGQQTFLIMTCAALATLPTAFLLHQIFNKSPINFFRTQIKIFKVSVTGAQFSK